MRKGALFMREAAIDWDAVPRGSYLRNIPALKGFTRLAAPYNQICKPGNGVFKSPSTNPLMVNRLVAGL